MEKRKRTWSGAIALVAVILLIVLQALSWRQSGTLNPGAFVLLVLVIGPIYAYLKGRNPDRL